MGLVSNDKINAALAASNMELMAEAHGLGVLYSAFILEKLYSCSYFDTDNLISWQGETYFYF